MGKTRCLLSSSSPHSTFPEYEEQHSWACLYQFFWILYLELQVSCSYFEPLLWDCNIWKDILSWLTRCLCFCDETFASGVRLLVVCLIWVSGSPVGSRHLICIDCYSDLEGFASVRNYLEPLVADSCGNTNVTLIQPGKIIASIFTSRFSWGE